MRLKLIIFSLLLLTLAQTASSHPSWGIVVDKHRNIYFADIMHNERGSVWKLTNDGKLKLLFQNFHAHNVSLDKEGNLVTAHGEMDEHYMIRLHKDGSIDTLYSATDYKVFNGGNCSFDSNGEIIFQAENYFWRLKENKIKEKISSHQFKWNQSIYADEEGNYYGPEIGDGKGKLIKISQDGKATVIATNLITKIPDSKYDKHNDVLLGITKGCDGKMYIAELAGSRIIKIENDGSISNFYRSEPNWSPSGIDFFSGDAYILEYRVIGGNAGPRIVKINEAGEKSILFDYDEYEEGKIISGSPINNRNNPLPYILIISIGLMGFYLILVKFRRVF